MFHAFNTKETARKIHSGCIDILLSVKEQLSLIVFKLSDQGVQYTNRMVTKEVTQIVPIF